MRCKQQLTALCTFLQIHALVWTDLQHSIDPQNQNSIFFLQQERNLHFHLTNYLVKFCQKLLKREQSTWSEINPMYANIFFLFSNLYSSKSRLWNFKAFHYTVLCRSSDVWQSITGYLYIYFMCLFLFTIFSSIKIWDPTSCHI